MKQTIQLTIELDVTGRLLRDPETGPNEVVDIRVEEVRLPSDTFTCKQAEAHFGELIDFALDEIDGAAWEEE